MRMNMISLEKKKNKMFMKIIENVRLRVMDITGLVFTLAFIIRGIVEAFEKTHIGVGIVFIILGIIDCLLWAMYYKMLLKSIDGAVQNFWNNLKIMAEVEDFDLVGEEKKSKHIPRID